jgi:hypothetical protein
MKRLISIAGIAGLLAGCMTSGRPTEATALRNRLFTAPFLEARSAGDALLRFRMFKSASKTTRTEIIQFLGPPDRMTKDAICYKTNGGPLWIEFSNDVLMHAALVAPPRWRGTDEELATWWEKARKEDTWDRY